MSDESANGGRQKTQFKLGRSGNPKGRPRKSTDTGDAILTALKRPVIVNEGGRRQRRATVDVIATQISNAGATGNLAAGKVALELGRKAEEQRAQKPAASEELSVTQREIAERFITRLHLMWEQEREADDESSS